MHGESKILIKEPGDTDNYELSLLNARLSLQYFKLESNVRSTWYDLINSELIRRVVPNTHLRYCVLILYIIITGIPRIIIHHKKIKNNNKANPNGPCRRYSTNYRDYYFYTSRPRTRSLLRGVVTTKLSSTSYSFLIVNNREPDLVIKKVFL